MPEHLVKLTNQRANLRPARPNNEFERCKSCVYFQAPDGCEIVQGPVAEDLVCDWIYSRGLETSDLYNVSDEDWLPFVHGMISKQPYQHIVIDGAMTPKGPMVLIEDTAEMKHRFSLTKEFHILHTSLEHHWTQAEVDALIEEGKADTRSATAVINRYAYEIVSAYWPRPAWLPDVKEVWVRNNVGKFRPSTFLDWVHRVFNPAYRQLERLYVLNDGTSRSHTEEDLHRERKWFTEKFGSKYSPDMLGRS